MCYSNKNAEMQVNTCEHELISHHRNLKSQWVHEKIGDLKVWGGFVFSEQKTGEMRNNVQKDDWQE